MAILHIPVQMANKAACATRLDIAGETLAAVLQGAIAAHPALSNKIYATPGNLNRFVRIFVDGKQAGRDLNAHSVSAQAEIKILVAMAGG